MKYFLLSYLLLLNTVLFSIDYHGNVKRNNNPVSEATIIIVELDLIEISNDEGNFVFYDLPPESENKDYTLKVITIEGDEQDFTFAVSSNTEATAQLFALIFDDEIVSEEIIITAQSEIQQSPTVTEYDESLVDNMPIPNNDPFNIVTIEAGVTTLLPKGAFSIAPVADPENGTYFHYGLLYSVFGGDSAWNQAYIDFFPIPSNTHTADSTKSIIHKESVSNVKTIKGPPPGVYGQSLGATVIIYPEDVSSTLLDVNISVTDPFLAYRTKIGKHLKLFTIARQSISQYTIFPLSLLIQKQVDKEIDVSIKDYLYGDWFFSLEYAKGSDVFKLISLVYYDTINISSDNKKDEASFSIKNFPYFFGGGIQWKRVVGNNAVNELVLHSYYYATKADALFKRRKIYKKATEKQKQQVYRMYRDFEYHGNASVLQTGLKDVYSLSLSATQLLSFGTSAEYARLGADYEDVFSYIFLNGGEGWGCTPKYTVNEQYMKLYAYTQYDYEENFNRGNMKLSLNPGVSWIYQRPSQVFPSLRGEVATTFNDIYTISFSAGWSPAFLEKLKYIDRKIQENAVKYKDSSTKYDDPNYGLMVFNKYLVALGNHQISLTPYFGWYYNFGGIFEQFRYDTNKNKRGYSYLPVYYGYGTGGTLRWQYITAKHLLDISYTLGFINFYTKDGDWLPPQNDNRHTVKFYYLYKAHEAFNFALTSSLIIDTPITPKVVRGDNPKDAENAEDAEFLIEKPEQVNSARSYLPQWSLVPSFSGNFIDNTTLTFNYRFALGNVLALATFTDDGLKDSAEGESNRDPSNQKYKIKPDIQNWARQFEFSLYLTFKL